MHTVSRRHAFERRIIFVFIKPAYAAFRALLKFTGFRGTASGSEEEEAPYSPVTVTVTVGRSTNVFAWMSASVQVACSPVCLPINRVLVWE